jgi:hypothetical protein
MVGPPNVATRIKASMAPAIPALRALPSEAS